MRVLAAFSIVLFLAALPAAAPAQRFGGRGGGTPRANPGRGFDLHNDVPRRPPAANNGNHNNVSRNNVNGNNVNRNNVNGNNVNRNNVNGNNVNRNNVNRNNVNGNNVNRNNVNVSGNTVNVNRNYNGYNSYGWHGAVVVNPIYRGPAWGWNRGVVWAPYPGYWGGGFWGPFAVGAASAAVMGAIVASNQTYTSYQASSGSPGSTLLSNYGLQQVPCGPPGLVVIYGPNNGVICANPNARVAAGSYAVNENNLTLQSR